MREIKFRAWYKERKIMGYFDLDCICDHGRVIYTDKDNYFSLVMKLMQYTGLKDINGKKIYFDDIVKFYFGDHCDYKK